MNKEIYEIIMNVVNEYNETAEVKISTELGENTPLFGVRGVLSSLELVNFIVMLEETIEDELGQSVQIVSEKAMSQKNSPFLTVGSLIDFIEKII